MLFEIDANVYIISGTPFLYLKSHRALIFGDVHFGQESSLNGSRNLKPINNSEVVTYLIEKLENLDKELEFNTIIVNGDIKHDTSFFNAQERSDLTYFLNSQVIRKKKCFLVRGNHDKLLKFSIRGLKNDNVLIKDQIDLGDTLVYHGDLDLNVEAGKRVILSHEHPAYMLTGRNRERMRLPAFVKLRSTKNNCIIILPASNKISTGVLFPIKDSANFLSPFLKKYANIQSQTIYPFDHDVGILPIPSET